MASRKDKDISYAITTYLLNGKKNTKTFVELILNKLERK